MKKKPLYIVGCGGLAKEVFCYAQELDLEITGFIDSKDNVECYLGKPVYSEEEMLSWKHEIGVIIAIGSPKVRKRVVEKCKNNTNISFPSVIAKSAVIYENVSVGQGCIIGPNTVITTYVRIGEFTVINCLTCIGHDTSIGTYTTINPGSNISGDVTIGTCCDIGTGTSIIQGINIIENTSIGAGCVIIRDVRQKNCLLVGVPGEIVRYNYDR